MKGRRKRTPGRTPIPVEECPYGQDGRNILERVNEAARRLWLHDRALLTKTLTSIEAGLAMYEHPDESRDLFDARIRVISGKHRGVN